MWVFVSITPSLQTLTHSFDMVHLEIYKDEID